MSASVQSENPTRERSTALEPMPHVREGLRAGVIGASVVAIFFLLFDLAAGRPLATPTALGAAVFLGEPIDLARPLSAPLVLGYSLLHGVAFVALSGLGAALLLGAERSAWSRWTPGVVFVGLFLACEVFFLVLSFFVGLSVWSAMGAGRVALANALASAAMTASLVHGLRERAATEPALEGPASP